MKVIAIANQKGGVAKTTTSVSLSTVLGRKGYRVLAIDTDAQMNMTNAMGVSRSDTNIYTVLTGRSEIGASIYTTAYCDLVPSSKLMASVDMELNGVGRENRLREAIQEGHLDGMYDFLIIDTPPALGVVSINALTAADIVIIPVVADFESFGGVGDLYTTIVNIRKYFNPGLKVAGILRSRWERRTNISKDASSLAEQAANVMGTKVFPTCIRKCVNAQEASMRNQNLWEYQPNCTTAQDFEAFTSELLNELDPEVD